MMPRKKDGSAFSPQMGGGGMGFSVLVQPSSSMTTVHDRFPASIHPVPLSAMGASATTLASLEAARLRQEKDQLFLSYSKIVDQYGLRPFPPNGNPFEEVRKQKHSAWGNVLDEAVWMSNDFIQERISRKAVLALIGSSVLQHRLMRPKTKAAKAMEEFWNNFGGPKDGRPLPGFISSNSVAASASMDSESTREPLLKPEANGVNNMSTTEKLDALRKLDRTLELKSTQSLAVADDLNFLAILSPTQNSSLRRLSVLGRHGLGSILCDSGESEHRVTIAAFLSRLKCDLNMDGPYLICGMTDLSLAYCRGYIALTCPQLRVVDSGDTDSALGSMEPTTRDVVFFKVLENTTLSAFNGKWGAVVFFANDETLLSWSAAPVMPKPKWGGPIVVLSQSDSWLFERPALVSNVASIAGVPATKLKEVLASPPSDRVETDFFLQECLVACSETEEQRAARKFARADANLLELAAIHADPVKGAHLHSAWGRSDSVPPPFRSTSQSSNGSELGRPSRRMSGKFEQALACLRSHSCRRSLVLSSRKIVLEAFLAFAAPFVSTFQFYEGSLNARVASWLRFIRSSENACILARFSDLIDAPDRNLNIAIDSVILLDVYCSEQDVARIKAVCKHALVFRLYTRGTTEQHFLQTSLHPSLVPANSSTGLQDRAEFRPIPRPFELPASAAGDTSTSSLQESMTSRSLLRYAYEYCTGENGSTSIIPTLVSDDSNHRRGVAGLTVKSASGPMFFDSASLPKHKLFPVSEEFTSNNPMMGSDAGPVLILSAVDRKRDASSVGQMSSKRRRGVEFELNGVSSASLLAGDVPTNQSMSSLIASHEAAMMITSSTFTREEDFFIKQLMDQGQTSPALIADALNLQHFTRMAPDVLLPPPPRTNKEVAERMMLLQSFPEKRDRSLFPLNITSSTFDGNESDVLAVRMQHWPRRLEAVFDDSASSSRSPVDAIASATPLLASETKRQGPLQLLTKPAQPSTVPPGSAGPTIVSPPPVQRG